MRTTCSIQRNYKLEIKCTYLYKVQRSNVNNLTNNGRPPERSTADNTSMYGVQVVKK